jgi:hypothetical protein
MIFPKDYRLSELIVKCPDSRVSSNQELQQELDNGILYSDLEICWFESGPVAIDDVIALLSPSTKWIGRLFLNWLKSFYDSKFEHEGILREDGVYVIRQIPLKIPSFADQIIALNASCEFQVYDFIHVSKLFEFAKLLPNCRTLRIKNNQIGNSTLNPLSWIKLIYKMLDRWHLELTGNPIFRMLLPSYNFYDELTPERARNLIFLSKFDYEDCMWQSLFCKNLNQNLVVETVNQVHADFYNLSKP